MPACKPNSKSLAYPNCTWAGSDVAAAVQCCANVEYILLADVRDTRFARDPLALMAANAKQYDLFFNTDRMNDWMQQRFAEIQHQPPQYEVGPALA